MQTFDSERTAARANSSSDNGGAGDDLGRLHGLARGHVERGHVLKNIPVAYDREQPGERHPRRMSNDLYCQSKNVAEVNIKEVLTTTGQLTVGSRNSIKINSVFAKQQLNNSKYRVMNAEYQLC